MDARFLKSVIAVVETGSIANAARVEHVSAAAVSQRIKAMETHFGFDLFYRVGHTVMPTSACIDLLPRLRRIVNEMRLLPGDVDCRGLSGNLRLGIIPSQVSPEFVATLTRIGCQCPDIHISLTQNASRTLYDTLISGELDAVIIAAPVFDVPKHVNLVALKEEPLVLISRAPIKKSIRETLMTEAYIESRPDVFVENPAKNYLQDQGLEIAPIFDTNSVHTIAMLVREGVGVSLVPAWRGIDSIDLHCAQTPVNPTSYFRKIVLLTSRFSGRPNMFEKLLEVLVV